MLVLIYIKSKLFLCAQQVVKSCNIIQLIVLQTGCYVGTREPIPFNVSNYSLVDYKVRQGLRVTGSHQVSDLHFLLLILNPLLVYHHSLYLLPLGLILLFLPLLYLSLQRLIILSQQSRISTCPIAFLLLMIFLLLCFAFVLLLYLLFFVFLVIDSVV
jgi:hypothetical protein